MMQKETVRIQGADLGTLKVGQSANLILPNGNMITTSPVVAHCIRGGVVWVETQNRYYTNRT